MKHKKKKVGNGWNKSRKWWVVVIGSLLILLAIIVWIIKEVPNPTKLASGDYSESSQIYDRKGRLLYELFADKRRVSVKINDVPKNIINATIAIEDNNFYKHNGFDLRGILRGLYRTTIENRLQGGSTITQQLVKNALLTQDRTWERKIKEALLTIATEIMYSKEKILEMYFNQTPYGGTMWGISAAAKGVFNKELKDLTLAESALLVGLPASPTRYSPFAHPDMAKKRQELVLKRMEELKMISKDDYEKAIKEPLNYYVKRNGIEAPHFVFYVKEQLVEKYGAKRVNEGGLKITTTLDLDVQKMAEEIVASEMAKLTKYNVTNGAVIMTDPKKGDILAMVGSKDYFSTEIDGKYNVTTASRQPGSSIKPINFAVGIERGLVTAASIFDDSPTCFGQENQKAYCPTNYGGAYHGVQTLRNTLGNSLNIGAVKMLKLNGVESFIASASAMGIDNFKDASNYGLSLTLGGGEVTMLQMSEAFGVLANMGVQQKLVSVTKIVDRNGKVLEEEKYDPGERVISRETSYIIGNILSDDGARSMVFGSGSLLNIKGHPEVSVKTGTTNDLRDNWTIGFTQDYLTTVWVGNNDNSKMRGVVSGTTGAAPIWNKIMTRILKDVPVKKPITPANIVTMSVCNLTGKLPPEGGCDSHNEIFSKDFVPTERMGLRQNVLIDKDTGRIVKDGEVKTNVEWQEHTVVVDAIGVKVCLDCPVLGNGDTSPSPVMIK